MSELLVLCSLVSVVGGCGMAAAIEGPQAQPVPVGDTPGDIPELLTLDDVSDFPEGTAIGDEFDGRTYEFLSRLIGDCECAVDETAGACASFNITPADGTVVLVQQEGGFLSFELVAFPGDIEDSMFATGPGTLNADGTWVQGGVSRVFDTETDETVGQSLFLTEGQFTEALLIMNSISRIQIEQDGNRVDCRVEADLIYRRIESTITP